MHLSTLQAAGMMAQSRGYLPSGLPGGVSCLLLGQHSDPDLSGVVADFVRVSQAYGACLISERRMNADEYCG
jgi:hypothetical protein